MPLTKVQAGLLEATGTPSAGTFLRGDGSWSGTLVSGTAITLTNQTAPEFTGIPSWAKRITVMFGGVSTNGTGIPIVQLGTSSGFTTSGYTSNGITGNSNVVVTTTNTTTGFATENHNPYFTAVATRNGQMIISLVGNNVWVSTSIIAAVVAGSPSAAFQGGLVTLSGTLDRIRLYIDGTQQFDAGTINILYEG
jgi:hypothetical protein